MADIIDASGRRAALESAGRHAIAIVDALGVHLHNRAETQVQLEEELAKEVPNGLYCALKELELATHSAALMQATGNLALLAALGVVVRPPDMSGGMPDDELAN